MKYPMTPKCYDTLKEELRKAKAGRPQISQIILEARELGDLSENAEYHAAKEKQGLLEAHIRDLEAKISQADVIDPSKIKGDRVMFGATVVIADVETGQESTYTILGEDESDVKKGVISITSPMARALINHTVGDEVTVRLPGGSKAYEVIDVRFVTPDTR